MGLAVLGTAALFACVTEKSEETTSARSLKYYKPGFYNVHISTDESTFESILASEREADRCLYVVNNRYTDETAARPPLRVDSRGERAAVAAGEMRELLKHDSGKNLLVVYANKQASDKDSLDTTEKSFRFFLWRKWWHASLQCIRSSRLLGSPTPGGSLYPLAGAANRQQRR